jgi:uncharacterized membrane protein
MGDTFTEAEARYWEIVRNTPPKQRLIQMAEMSQSIRHLMEMGVRHRNPKASDSEVRRRVFELMYARDFGAEELLEWERRLGLIESLPA